MGRPAWVVPSGLSGQAGSLHEPQQSGELRDDSVPLPQNVFTARAPSNEFAASSVCQTEAPVGDGLRVELASASVCLLRRDPPSPPRSKCALIAEPRGRSRVPIRPRHFAVRK